LGEKRANRENGQVSESHGGAAVHCSRPSVRSGSRESTQCAIAAGLTGDVQHVLRDEARRRYFSAGISRKSGSSRRACSGPAGAYTTKRRIGPSPVFSVE